MYDLTAKLVDGEEVRLVIEKRRHREKEAESRERKDEKKKSGCLLMQNKKHVFTVSNIPSTCAGIINNNTPNVLTSEDENMSVEKKEVL